MEVKYRDKKCPFCKTNFKNDDHVVECLSCGIPHHRECWEENGGCTTFGCSQQYYKDITVSTTEYDSKSDGRQLYFRQYRQTAGKPVAGIAAEGGEQAPAASGIAAENREQAPAALSIAAETAIQAPAASGIAAENREQAPAILDVDAGAVERAPAAPDIAAEGGERAPAVSDVDAGAIEQAPAASGIAAGVPADSINAPIPQPTRVCSRCGSKLEEQHLYCALCGQPAMQPVVNPGSPPVFFCTWCGTKMHQGQFFCTQCGRSVK